MKFTLDTNLLCYAYDRADPLRRAQARSLIARAGTANCILTMQTLGEFYSVSVRKFGVSKERATAAVERLRRSFRIEVADLDCLTAAIALNRTHGTHFWDALLCATAEKAGCTLLFSEDGQDGRQLGAILIVNPFNPANRELLDAALPPSD